MRVTLVGAVLSMAVLLPQVGNAQYDNEPVTVGGLIYYRTEGTRFFDANKMSQVGTYRGVPVFEDAMQEPFSVVYVPVGRGLVRAYERRAEAQRPTANEPTPVATSGEQISPPVPMTSSATTRPITPASMRVESVRQPSAANGIWVEFNGARWYASGAPVQYDPERFTKIGHYRGFPVYRGNNSNSDSIWIRITQDGPIAPYSRR